MIWLVAGALWVTFGAGVAVGALLVLRTSRSVKPEPPAWDIADERGWWERVKAA